MKGKSDDKTPDSTLIHSGDLAPMQFQEMRIDSPT